MNNFSKSARRRIVRADLYALMSTLDQFKGVPIILLYSTVLEVCGPPLREAGHCVLTDTFITPGFSGQPPRRDRSPCTGTKRCIRRSEHTGDACPWGGQAAR